GRKAADVHAVPRQAPANPRLNAPGIVAVPVSGPSAIGPGKGTTRLLPGFLYAGRFVAREPDIVEGEQKMSAESSEWVPEPRRTPDSPPAESGETPRESPSDT